MSSSSVSSLSSLDDLFERTSNKSDDTVVNEGDEQDPTYENPPGYEDSEDESDAFIVSDEELEASDVSDDYEADLIEVVPKKRSLPAKVTISSRHHCELMPHGGELLSIYQQDVIDQMQPDLYALKMLNITRKCTTQDTPDFVPLLIASDASNCLFPITAQDDIITLRINISFKRKSHSDRLVLSVMEERKLTSDLKRTLESFFEQNKEVLGLHRVAKKHANDDETNDFSILLELDQIDQRSPIYQKEPLAMIHAIDLAIVVDTGSAKDSTISFRGTSSKLIEQLIKFCRKQLVERYKALFNGAFRARMEKCLEHMARIANIMSEINSSYEAYQDRSRVDSTFAIDIPRSSSLVDNESIERISSKQDEEALRIKDHLLKKDLAGNFCSSFKPDFNRDVYKTTFHRKDKPATHAEVKSRQDQSVVLEDDTNYFERDYAIHQKQKQIFQNSFGLLDLNINNNATSSRERTYHEEAYDGDEDDSNLKLVPLPISAMMSNDGRSIYEQGMHICPSSDGSNTFTISNRSSRNHRQMSLAKVCDNADLTKRELAVLNCYEQFISQKRVANDLEDVEHDTSVLGNIRKTRKVKIQDGDKLGSEDESTDKSKLSRSQMTAMKKMRRERILKRVQRHRREREVMTIPQREESSRQVEDNKQEAVQTMDSNTQDQDQMVSGSSKIVNSLSQIEKSRQVQQDDYLLREVEEEVEERAKVELSDDEVIFCPDKSILKSKSEVSYSDDDRKTTNTIIEGENIDGESWRHSNMQRSFSISVGVKDVDARYPSFIRSI